MLGRYLKNLRPGISFLLRQYNVSSQNQNNNNPPNGEKAKTVTDYSSQYDKTVLSSRRVPLKPLPEFGSEDLIIEELKSANDKESIMKIIQYHHAVMNNKHLCVVYRSIYNICYLKNKEEIADIPNSAGFKKLCNATMKRMRFFELEEIITILKVLIQLDIPQDTAIFQATCQMLRHSVNDLSLQQILFLDRILNLKKNSNTNSPLVLAIQMALPLIFKSKLEYQLDGNDMNLVLHSFQMAMQHNIKSSKFDSIQDIILTKGDQLNQEQIKFLFFKVAGVKYQEAQQYAKLTHFVLQSMMTFIKDLNWKQMNVILANLIISHNPLLKNEKLLTILSHKSVVENWELWKLSFLLDVFNHFQFVSTEVLDLVASHILKNSEELATDNRVSVLTIVRAFAMADYLPGGSHEHLRHLINCEDKISKLEHKSSHYFLKFVTYLSVLKAVTPELLQKVLNPDFVDLALQRGQKGPNVLQLYRVLDTAAKLECPNYQGPFLDSALLQRSIQERSQYVKTIDLVLQNFLELGLGGSQFMLSGLWTQFGHFIDHLIVMRKGDFPVALGPSLTTPDDKDGLKYVEDVVIPQDAKILAVTVARQEWFTTNPTRQTAWASFHHRTLAQLGYNPIILGPPIITKGHSQDFLGDLDNEDVEG